MQFIDGMVWSLTDFIVAGVLLFTADLAYELVAAQVKSDTYRVALGIGIAVILLLIWVELAVGIFGTPWAGS